VNDLPAVSVVVAAVNEQDAIGQCLTSLLGVDYPPERREIVIVDNGSTDATRELVERYPVQLLREERRGVGWARNAGVGATSGEIVVFTDPDCVATTGWLTELAAGFRDEEVGAVAGAIVPYPPSSRAELYAARRMSHSQLRPLRNRARPFAMTPNLAVRRDALERIGCFDVRLPGGGFEDADLCWRLSAGTGLELRYAPRAVVFHRYRSTAREFLVQHHRYGRGLALLRRKYPGEIDWGWRARRRAYGQLAGSALRLGRLAALHPVRHGEGEELGLAAYDFLRHVGQRSGFARGSLAGTSREDGPS
jgi:GT2 family glycosyltransferase